jgi:hypothetical protein
VKTALFVEMKEKTLIHVFRGYSKDVADEKSFYYCGVRNGEATMCDSKKILHYECKNIYSYLWHS